jgi:Uma2 family endonuclease
METLIADPRLSQRLIEERRARGIDRFDEVWEGVYVMAPAPNDEHQDIVGGFTEVLRIAIDRNHLGRTRPGINLASDPVDWEHNYRVPDVTVFLDGSTAVCVETFWYGPPDFVVEIVSPWDKTREKFDFYEKVGARELLVVDREPWKLELHQLQGGKLVCAAQIGVDDAGSIKSQVLPLEFRLASDSPRPTILVATTDGQQSWTI